MDIEPFRDLSVDLFEKLQELDRPVTLVAFADDKPRGDIECSKQRGRTMPHRWGNSELQVRCKVDDRTHIQEPEIAESL